MGYGVVGVVVLGAAGLLTVTGKPVGAPPAVTTSGEVFRVTGSSVGRCGAAAPLASPPLFLAVRYNGNAAVGQTCEDEPTCRGWAFGTSPRRSEVGDWSALSEGDLVRLSWRVTAGDAGVVRSGPADGTTLTVAEDASGACSVRGIRTSLRRTPAGAQLHRVFESAAGDGSRCPELPTWCDIELTLEAAAL